VTPTCSVAETPGRRGLVVGCERCVWLQPAGEDVMSVKTAELVSTNGGRRQEVLMRRIAVLTITLLAAGSAGFAQDTARMDAVVQSFVSNGTFSGAVLVARGGDVVFAKGYGMAHVERKVANSAATRFRVASITKQFTAAAILLLAERGRLTLDDPVKTHLPNAPASWDGMTILHLLDHTAGFQGLSTPPPARVPIESPDGSLEGFVTAAMKQPLESAPGATFNYTNSGYFVLGHLIEKLSRQSYERFIRENILTPLGLKDTGLASAANTDIRARFYNASPKGPVETALPDRVVPNSAAGFYSTAADLLRWQTALYGGKVISAVSLEKMTARGKGDYGLGVYIRSVAGLKVFNHGGGAPAFANLSYFPDSRTSVAVLGNINVSPGHELAALLGALAHGQQVTLTSERKAITLPAEVLARYAGVYQGDGGPPLVVAVEGGQLVLRPNNQGSIPLLAESERMFFIREPNLQVEFVRDASGAVTEFITHQGGRQDRARRIK
jgi:CubicO group peptidase (beta-lactamase class C family)